MVRVIQHTGLFRQLEVVPVATTGLDSLLGVDAISSLDDMRKRVRPADGDSELWTLL